MPMSTDIVYHSIAQSNIPKTEKNSLLQMVDRLTKGSISRYEEKNIEGKVVHKGHMHSALSVLRQDSEAFVFGGLVGAADAEMSGTMSAPVAAAVGAILAIVSSGTWMETSARNLSATGMGIMGYQAGANFVKEKRLVGKSSVGGEVHKDPIIDWANKNL